MNGKLSGCAMATLIVITVFNVTSSSAQSGYTVTERGPDWKMMEKTTVENGTNRVHKYMELAAGLHYTNAYGQLAESKKQIAISPNGGAAAEQGWLKVYFPANIYNGVIEVVTPEGRHIKSRPLGVSYDDGSDTVFIAELKSANGYLTSSNQVTYRDAFTGIKADLVCTYRCNGFECDLVFRQKPPTPTDYGLDEGLSSIQLVTEFFSVADPEQIPAAADEWFGLQDTTLKFGKLMMTQGRAFAVNGTNSSRVRPSSVPVYKSWHHSAGRTFLVESVPLLDIAEDLGALPLTASAENPRSRTKSNASDRQYPPTHELRASTNQVLLALNEPRREPGVVLDYNEIYFGDAFTDFTFEADTTYLVDWYANFDGTTTFKAGAVIKIDGSTGMAPLQISGDVVCEGTPENPTIFTIPGDNNFGESVPASGDYANFIQFGFDPITMKNCRFYNADTAIATDGDLHLENCEFHQAHSAISAFHGTVLLRNVLFGNVTQPVMMASGTIQGEQVTYSQGFLYFVNINSGEINLTNSIIYSGYNNRLVFPSQVPYVTLNTNNVAIITTNVGVFTLFNPLPGLTEYYLVTNSPYRDVGTANIYADLLAALPTTTTFAPECGRCPDTNTPDLGYHYPLDEDSDRDGLQDWWEWKWFGGLFQKAADNSYTSAPEELLLDTMSSISNSVLPSWRDVRPTPVPEGMALGILIRTNYPFEVTKIEAEVIFENIGSLSDTDIEVGFFRNTNRFAIGMYADPEFIASDADGTLSKTLTDLGNGHWLLRVDLPAYAWGTNRLVTIRTVPLSSGAMTKMSFIGTSATVPGMTAYISDNTTTNMTQAGLPKMRVWRRMLPATQWPSFTPPNLPSITDLEMADLDLTWLPGCQLGSTTNLSLPFDWHTDDLHMWRATVDIREGRGFFLTRPDPTE